MTESKKRVLIIDDEPDFCEILKADLQKAGYDIQTAPEGRQGFSRATDFVPDCVILDIRIRQGEDGFTFLRRLRSFRHDDPLLQDKMRRTPVLVLTAAGKEMRALFEAEGISGFLEKPFDSEELKNRLARIIDRS